MKKVHEILAKITAVMTPFVLLRMAWGFLIVMIIALLWSVYLTVMKFLALQPKSKDLALVSSYVDERSQVSLDKLRKDVDAQKLISDVMWLQQKADGQTAAIKGYFSDLQKPYENLLQYFLLPPLNIWKDKYTGQIDSRLIGEKYLDNNIYLDVNMVSRRTEFFKNIGSDSAKNEIKTIDVGGVVEREWWVFIIPISLTFAAQTKRSFLLLVDKLSMTSNRVNLALMNEFFYNVWNVLAEKDIAAQKGEMEAVAALPRSEELWNTWTLDTWSTAQSPVRTLLTDKQIGQKFYAWVYASDADTFVTSADIQEAVKRTASCEGADVWSSKCYFMFREKMRSLPQLAYTIGMESSDKVAELRNFLKTLPPIINVKSFVFQKENSATNATQDSSAGLVWQLSVDIYGKSMSEAEVQEIALYLGNQCTNGVPLDPDVALRQIDVYISKADSIEKISNEKSKQFIDLKKALTAINGSYAWLPGFKKAIKLFEVYRMLDENRLCNTK
jgi:hypothetical protein